MVTFSLSLSLYLYCYIGEHDAVLLAGGEALYGLTQLAKEGHVDEMKAHGWGDNPGGKPIMLGIDRHPTTDMEEEHNMHRPIHVYALFETAIRAHKGHTLSQHMEFMGKLFEDFTKVCVCVCVCVCV